MSTYNYVSSVIAGITDGKKDPADTSEEEVNKTPFIIPRDASILTAISTRRRN